jgi:ribulose 1,5-bisphosphate synthetase/thiazole synthase
VKKNAVYWWEEAPLAALDRKSVAPAADVVIVGAGYTGLGAAIKLARAGRSVQVFDKQHPGEGASMIGPHWVVRV